MSSLVLTPLLPIRHVKQHCFYYWNEEDLWTIDLNASWHHKSSWSTVSYRMILPAVWSAVHQQKCQHLFVLPNDCLCRLYTYIPICSCPVANDKDILKSCVFPYKCSIILDFCFQSLQLWNLRWFIMVLVNWLLTTLGLHALLRMYKSKRMS